MPRRTPVLRDTRERLLQAAQEVFAERGYQSASIDDIVARAGTTKGALYYYFTDKEDLARDLQQQLWERLAAEAQRAFDPDAGVLTNLKLCFAAHLGALQDLGEARFFLRDCWTVGALDVAGRLQREAETIPVRGLLVAGMASGEVAPLDPGALARALLGAFADSTLYVLSGGDAEAATAVIHRFIDALQQRPQANALAEVRSS